MARASVELILFEDDGLREDLESTASSAASEMWDLGRVSTLLRIANAHLQKEADGPWDTSSFSSLEWSFKIM